MLIITVGINDPLPAVSAGLCQHPDAYVEKACCPPGGLVECACGGRDAVICPAENCTGITDEEYISIKIHDASMNECV